MERMGKSLVTSDAGSQSGVRDVPFPADLHVATIISISFFISQSLLHTLFHTHSEHPDSLRAHIRSLQQFVNENLHQDDEKSHFCS